LLLDKRIAVTKEVYNLLREAKRQSIKDKKKTSIAKIVCNLVIEKYG
jgi:hypothetical protein